MDRKRIANGYAAGANGAGGIKNGDHFNAASNVETTKKGLELVAAMRDCKDKNGRPATTTFYSLPSIKDNERYYSIVKAPISLDIIEEKLRNYEFPDLTALESYIKRMVTNIKETEIRDSPLYKDIDRMRKLVSNWMKKANPAYDNPQYQPGPTPLTDDFIAHHQALARGEDATGDKAYTFTSDPLPPSNKTRRQSESKRRASSTPAPTAPLAPPVNENEFSGLSFQEAQQKLIQDMKDHEVDSYQHFELFVKLPPKSYKEYYQVIPNPICLNDLAKAVSFKSGELKYKTWKDFETEVALLWKNARHFNVDDSDPYKLSIDLEKFFKKRVKLAKQVVLDPSQEPKEEPVATKLKLRLGRPPITETTPTPKISLRLGSKTATPVQKAAPLSKVPAAVQNQTPAVIEDSANAERMQSEKRKRSSTSSALDDGEKPSKRGRRHSTQDHAVPIRASPSPAPAPAPEQAPAPSPKSQSTNKEMPPPPTPKPSSVKSGNATPNPATAPAASATPNVIAAAASAVGAAAPATEPVTGAQPSLQPAPVVQAPPPPPPYHPAYHPDGKDASMALIKHVIINTHPGIHIKNHYRIVFYADDDEAQQDFMITCRKEHFFLQISPQFASIDRQHKIFATVNTGGNMRPLQALPQTPGLAVDPLNPLYETRLNPGGNQIIIEVIADAYPQVKAKSGVQIEHEKMTIMAFLLK